MDVALTFMGLAFRQQMKGNVRSYKEKQPADAAEYILKTEKRKKQAM